MLHCNSHEPGPLQQLAALALIISVFVYTRDLVHNPGPVVGALIFYLEIFRVPLLFFIGGMMAVRALAGRSTSAYFNGLIGRLLLSLAFGATLLLGFELGTLIGAEHDAYAGTSFAHLWLVFYLLLLSMVAAVAWRTPVLQRAGARLAKIAVRPGGILLLAIPVGIVFFLRPGWGGFTPLHSALLPDFPLFLACSWYFAIGLVAGRKDAVLDRFHMRWRIKLIVTAIFTAVIYSAHDRLGSMPQTPELLGGPRRALYCLSYAFLSWRWIIALTGLFRARFTEPSPVRFYLAGAAWWIYIIHIPVILFTQSWMSAITRPVSAQYFLVVATTLALCFAGYELAVRHTPLRRWLGAESPWENGSQPQTGEPA